MEDGKVDNGKMKVTGIILAGGKSLRLGRNKAMEPISGKALIQCVYDRLKPFAAEVLVVTSEENTGLPYPEGTKVLADLYPGKGPLAGVYTGLVAARYEYSIVVGCDMPFLNAKLLRHMVEQARGFDAAVPRVNEVTVEPLHAVYSKSCLNAMKSQLDRGRLEVYAFFPEINVRYLSPEECRKFDSELSSFINVNCQKDLDKARQATEAGKR